MLKIKENNWSLNFTWKDLIKQTKVENRVCSIAEFSSTNEREKTIKVCAISLIRRLGSNVKKLPYGYKQIEHKSGRW